MEQKFLILKKTLLKAISPGSLRHLALCDEMHSFCHPCRLLAALVSFVSITGSNGWQLAECQSPCLVIQDPCVRGSKVRRCVVKGFVKFSQFRLWSNEKDFVCFNAEKSLFWLIYSNFFIFPEIAKAPFNVWIAP